MRRNSDADGKVSRLVSQFSQIPSPTPSPRPRTPMKNLIGAQSTSAATKYLQSVSSPSKSQEEAATKIVTARVAAIETRSALTPSKKDAGNLRSRRDSQGVTSKVSPSKPVEEVTKPRETQTQKKGRQALVTKPSIQSEKKESQENKQRFQSEVQGSLASKNSTELLDASREAEFMEFNKAGSAQFEEKLTDVQTTSKDFSKVRPGSPASSLSFKNLEGSSGRPEPSTGLSSKELPESSKESPREFERERNKESPRELEKKLSKENHKETPTESVIESLNEIKQSAASSKELDTISSKVKIFDKNTKEFETIAEKFRGADDVKREEQAPSRSKEFPNNGKQNVDESARLKSSQKTSDELENDTSVKELSKLLENQDRDVLLEMDENAAKHVPTGEAIERGKTRVTFDALAATSHASLDVSTLESCLSVKSVMSNFESDTVELESQLSFSKTTEDVLDGRRSEQEKAKSLKPKPHKPKAPRSDEFDEESQANSKSPKSKRLKHRSKTTEGVALDEEGLQTESKRIKHKSKTPRSEKYDETLKLESQTTSKSLKSKRLKHRSKTTEGDALNEEVQLTSLKSKRLKDKSKTSEDLIEGIPRIDTSLKLKSKKSGESDDEHKRHRKAKITAEALIEGQVKLSKRNRKKITPEELEQVKAKLMSRKKGKVTPEELEEALMKLAKHKRKIESEKNGKVRPEINLDELLHAKEKIAKRHKGRSSPVERPTIGSADLVEGKARLKKKKKGKDSDRVQPSSPRYGPYAYESSGSESADDVPMIQVGRVLSGGGQDAEEEDEYSEPKSAPPEEASFFSRWIPRVFLEPGTTASNPPPAHEAQSPSRARRLLTVEHAFRDKSFPVSIGRTLTKFLDPPSEPGGGLPEEFAMFVGTVGAGVAKTGVALGEVVMDLLGEKKRRSQMRDYEYQSLKYVLQRDELFKEQGNVVLNRAGQRVLGLVKWKEEWEKAWITATNEFIQTQDADISHSFLASAFLDGALKID